MRHRNHPFAEDGFMDIIVKLAHTTFFDALPSNADNHPPTAPATLPGQLEAAPALHERWLANVERWAYQCRMRERDAYLGRATDVQDLENRMRDFHRRPYY